MRNDLFSVILCVTIIEERSIIIKKNEFGLILGLLIQLASKREDIQIAAVSKKLLKLRNVYLPFLAKAKSMKPSVAATLYLKKVSLISLKCCNYSIS